VAATLGKLAMDICLYMSQDLNFISFPDQLTTGSSIMPHKKNPDVFELIRGKCNSLHSVVTDFNNMSINLNSGYHRDLQLFKQKIIDSITEIKNCLEIVDFTIKKIIVRKNILDDEKYKYVYSVENLNKLVNEGVSFRDAYMKISKEIKENTFKPNKEFNHTLKGSIGNLCLEEIKLKLKNVIDF